MGAMIFETYVNISNLDSDITDVLGHFGTITLVEKEVINKSSFNDFNEEYDSYQHIIYTYKFTPVKGLETLAESYIRTLWATDILN
jgi:hypothetical protein